MEGAVGMMFFFGEICLCDWDFRIVVLKGFLRVIVIRRRFFYLFLRVFCRIYGCFWAEIFI